ncbi:RNA polymerase sigma factor [Sorangium atrum]|uniref:RNA polymerase sigma factor n=1 Tax=Sorangium atrum TaxID=2995308 RepID=A0ABT5BVA3_9BACT|nr:RNA polymerase sigma factor [Sorangium aterium]MDC0678090.1 RNA polymerase sigma factor [Sorangium aterium]
MQQLVEHGPLLERPSFETVYTVGLSFLRQALRWLGVAERDIDDVLQDVMLAAYHALDRFDPRRCPDEARAGHHPCGHAPSLERGAPQTASPLGEPLRRWLFGIAWRQVGHYRERAYRRREIAVGAGASWPFELADPGLTSEQLLAREQSGQLVGRLLGAIDTERRVVLIMHDLLDVTTADIARDLDVNENTVRNRLRLAREDFRVAVKRMNAEDRRALHHPLSLPVAERSRAADEESLMSTARLIPEVPDALRRRIWLAVMRAIAEAHAAGPSAQACAAPAP